MLYTTCDNIQYPFSQVILSYDRFPNAANRVAVHVLFVIAVIIVIFVLYYSMSSLGFHHIFFLSQTVCVG